MRELVFILIAILVLPSCADSRVSTSNSAPEAAILEPAPDALYTVGALIEFRGAVEDRGTSPEDLEVTWSSSRDGLLLDVDADAEGETAFSSDALSTGEHTITLRVVDPDGASGTDAVTVTVEDPVVENTSPTCVITAPQDGSTVAADATVILQGTVGDAESAPDTLIVTWQSSEDGDLGAATPSTSGAVALPVDGLSSATHVLTMDVEDPDGASCSEFVILTVEPDNQPPAIGTPTVTPSPLVTTDTATCTAPTPTDPEGGAVTVALSWLVDASDVGVSGGSLDGQYFVKGQQVQCVATPSDDFGAGDPATSALVDVLDLPPTQPTVVINPAAPIDADDLVAVLGTPSTDADGEAVSYGVAWTRNAAPWTGAVGTTTFAGDTIVAADTSEGDTWIVTVTPSAGGVAGPAATDSVTIPLPPPPGKTVFVTSTTGSGSLGGVTGADAVCQARATAAGLSGTYKAWLSAGTYSSSPASRFTRSLSQPYVRTDGVQIAANWAALTDGAIDAPINVNEFGATQTSPSMVYSFTMTDGSNGLFGSSSEDCYGGDCHCSGWTSTATQGNPIPGSAVAQVSQTNDDWTDYSFGNFCGGSYGFYCFQQ